MKFSDAIGDAHYFRFDEAPRSAHEHATVTTEESSPIVKDFEPERPRAGSSRD